MAHTRYRVTQEIYKGKLELVDINTRYVRRYYGHQEMAAVFRLSFYISF